MARALDRRRQATLMPITRTSSSPRPDLPRLVQESAEVRSLIVNLCDLLATEKAPSAPGAETSAPSVIATPRATPLAAAALPATATPRASRRGPTPSALPFSHLSILLLTDSYCQCDESICPDRPRNQRSTPPPALTAPGTGQRPTKAINSRATSSVQKPYLPAGHS